MRSGLTYRAACWFLAVWMAVFGTAAFAQQSVEYQNWERAATEIENAIENDDLDLDALDTLRQAIDIWRSRFVSDTGINETRIGSLRTQLEALGPPPMSGDFEAEDIANQRQNLNEALAEARAPRIAAEAALARANKLISQIDSRIREVQADALFEFKGSPLSPSVWQDALGLVGETLEDVRGEVAANINDLRNREQFGQRIPIVILLLAAAIFLIVPGPRAVERLVERVEQRSSEQGQIVFGYIVSLGTIVLPLIGITLIGFALISTGILGPVGEAIAVGVNVGIVTVASSRWLSSRIFPDRDDADTPVHLNSNQRRQGRSLGRMAGLLLAILLFFQSIDDVEGYSGLFISIVAFPVLVALGVVLFFLGRLLRVGRGSEEEGGYTNYLLGIIGPVIQLIAIVGPIAAAVGYYNLARGLLVPLTQTLAVVAFLVTLHYVIRAAYGMIRRLSVTESDRALVPVLLSFVLSALTVPVVALFWGARQTDLLELWTRFLVGVKVGEGTITPGDFATVILVFLIGLMLTRLFQGILRGAFLPRTRIDKGGRNAIVSGLGYVGITLAALAGVTAAGIDLSAFAIIVGALGVGIGFGLQNIVNNFVSGIILLIERPIGEGDMVEVGQNFGVVKSISVRSTVIETFDRQDVIVPNGDLVSGVVTNWTRGNSVGRLILPIGVAYGTDTHKVEAILREVAEAHPMVAVNPAPNVLFRNFGADSLEFEIRAILKDVNFLLVVRSDMNHEIARRFTEEGIEIPFAQRDIWLRNPEALAGSAASASEPVEEEAHSPRPPSPPPDPRLLGDVPGEDE